MVKGDGKKERWGGKGGRKYEEERKMGKERPGKGKKEFEERKVLGGPSIKGKKEFERWRNEDLKKLLR
jgi:hypothetical protein